MKRTLKRIAKLMIDQFLVPPIRYLVERSTAPSLLGELAERSVKESADYAHQRMGGALQFQNKRDLWDHALGASGPDGLIVEFGVWKGESANFFASRVFPRVVHGFDSFEGLEEDWAGWKETKGAFNLGGRMPRVRPNVNLVKGRFSDTLPQFLESNPASFAFVHIDSDTYEAAKTVLGLAGDRIVPGTVLVFDEYLNYRGWRIGEFKAWQDFVSAKSLAYDYLGFSEQQVAIRVRGK